MFDFRIFFTKKKIFFSLIFVGKTNKSLSQQVNGGIGKKLIPGSKTKIFPIIGTDRSSNTTTTTSSSSSSTIAATTTTTTTRIGLGSRTGSQDKTDDDMDSMLMMKPNLGTGGNGTSADIINMVKDSSICRLI